MDAIQPSDLLARDPVAVETYERVRRELESLGPVEVRTTRSQIAFRRRHDFAWLWRPGQYLGRPAAPVVLSIALPRHDGSSRFKEVVQRSPRHWMHHLEVTDPAQIDDEVVAWLREAGDHAGEAHGHG